MTLTEAIAVAANLPVHTPGAQRPAVWLALEALACEVTRTHQPTHRHALCLCCHSVLIDGMCANCDC